MIGGTTKYLVGKLVWSYKKMVEVPHMVRGWKMRVLGEKRKYWSISPPTTIIEEHSSLDTNESSVLSVVS